MEKLGDWAQRNLIHELTHGRELARQLQMQLNVTASSSHETHEFLVHRIVNSYENALSMLGCNNVGSSSIVEAPQPAGAAPGMSESPRSFSGSPHSEDSDREFKDLEHRDTPRKRKSMKRWTKQVQVCPGTGLEGPLDDGYNWRKYGQKDILGAKYPRGYYRCTHRNVQGCLATKQVQRSDEDPTIFEVTYRGTHICTQGSYLTQPPAASSPKQEPNKALDNQGPINHRPQKAQQYSHETLRSFQTGLKVTTEDLSTSHQSTPPSFLFPSTSYVKLDPNFNSSAMMLADNDNNFMGHFSTPSFVSPSTSGSNYFSVSPSHVANFGGTKTLQGSDHQSELGEIVSAATSTTNSPTVGLDFPFGGIDQYDPTFSFENHGFFF